MQVSSTAETVYCYRQLPWPLLPMISQRVLHLFLISRRCFQFNLFIEVLYNLHNSVALCLHQHLSLKFLPAVKPRIPYQHLSHSSRPANSSTHYWTVHSLKYWRWSISDLLIASTCGYWPHARLDPCGALNLWVCSWQLHRNLGPCSDKTICSGVSPGFEFRSCFLLRTGHILNKLFMQLEVLVSKIYFYQEVLVNLASSFIEN